MMFQSRPTLTAIAAFALAVGPVAAQAGNLVPFADFVAGLSSTPATAMTSEAGSGVKTPAAAEAMRQHLLRQYSGVSVAHSFMEADEIFDCVPIDQQPGVRLTGAKAIASAPVAAPTTALARGSAGATGAMATQKTTGFDAAGNSRSCEAGSIPMQRTTLHDLARFATLEQFFQKGPNGAGRAHVEQNAAVPPAVYGHRYAHEYQYVNNYGGYGQLALYRPYVNGSRTEIFSLSQQWYVGGSGSGLQTAEIGWQNYPQLYGSENSALFIYWTADGYNSTGCYNLTCGAFVQVNSNWHFGGGFSNYSTVGGPQYLVSLGFYLYQGNWWLAAGNDWVGYYPGSIYRGGQLSRYAQIFDMGGEVVGATHYPPMGSGQWASAGWPYAAYHRSILWRDAANGGHNPALTRSQPSPSCYSATAPTWGGPTWKTYFFFGGPGGYNC